MKMEEMADIIPITATSNLNDIKNKIGYYNSRDF